MKNTWKRLLALILAMAMCLTLLSVNVWAAEVLPQKTEASVEEAETLAEESLSVRSSKNDSSAKQGAEEETEETSEEAAILENQEDQSTPENENDFTEESSQQAPEAGDASEYLEAGEIHTEERYFDPFSWERSNATQPDDIWDEGLTTQTIPEYNPRSGYGGELSTSQKKIYDSLVSNYVGEDGLSNGMTEAVTVQTADLSIRASTTNALFQELYYAFWAFAYDYPELFWIGGVSISISYYNNNGTYDLDSAKFSIMEKYSGAKTQVGSYNAEVRAVADSIYRSVTTGQTYDLYKAIHDWMCEYMSYNDEAVDAPEEYAWAYSNGPVFTGNPRVTCQGYGETYKVLCDQVRIRNHLDELYCADIIGRTHTGASHMWNYVWIDDLWFAVDTLWDDQSTIRYTYFLCGSDSQGFQKTFREEHIEDNSFSENRIVTFNYPVIEKEKYNSTGPITEPPFKPVAPKQIIKNYTYLSDLEDSNHKKVDITNEFRYADVWLMNNDAEFRYALMKTSIRVAQAAFGQKGSVNIEDMMDKMGYQHTADSVDYDNPNINTIGSAIGMKNIKLADGSYQSLILVAIRGGGYGTEWGGNFNVGNESKYHAGFEQAANTVHSRLSSFINENQEYISENPIIWITGFSRGAATSNLLASYLIDQKTVNGVTIDLIQPENVLAYCFECPKNVVDSNASNAKYDNIINIVNPIDFVPKLAFNRWSFTRYGRTYCIPSKETTPNFESAYKIPMIWKYQDLCTRNNAVLTDDYVVELNGQASNLDSLLDEVSSKITRNRFSLYLQESMIEIAANALGNAGGNVNWFHAVVSMIAAINLPADDGDIMKTAVQLALGKLSVVQKIKFVEKVATLCIHAPSVFVMFKDAGDCKGPGASAHYSELCMSWIDSLQGFSAYNTSENSWYRRHIINCPVDVTVRDHTGRVVGKVTNHQAEEIEDGVTAFVDDNDQIVFALPMSEKYTVEVQATDNGNVDYMIQEVNGAEGTLENVIAYQEIPVTGGDTITVQSDDTETELSERYVLKKEDEENPREPDAVLTEEEVERFTVTTAVEGKGTVTGGGYVIKGEYIKVTAAPEDGAQFLGWYEGEICICDTPEYRFPVEQDVELTAVFMGASSNDASYQVTIDSAPNGTVTSDKTEAKENDTIILAVTPDKGYQLDTLTYTPEGGEAISIGVNSDGNCAFQMPGAKVTVRAVFTPHNHRVSTEVRNAKAATCGAAGYTGDIWCKDCGIKLEKGRAIPATGKHVWDSGKVTTQPTYTTKGVKTYTCTVCRQTKTESINKLPQPAAAQPTPSQPTAKTSNTISVAARFTKTANPKKNQSFRLGARANGAPLSYQSSNRKKVSVAKNGKVSIKKGFVGKVRITIKSAETDKYLPATKKVTITVQPSATQISSVKWDAKKKVANVNWRKNTTGKGYEVQVSLKMNFKKVAKKAVIKKNDTVKTAIKGLKKGTWYFRIRTVNRKNYSKWSKVKTLKIAK